MEGADRRLPGRESFGALLRSWREDAGLSQERLADRAGLAVRTIGHLERDERRPHRATVQRILDAIGVDGPAREELLAAAAGRAQRGSHEPPVQPGRPGAVVPAQLPADVAAFTGRVHEVGQLDALLAGLGDDGAFQGGDATAVVISAVAGTAGVGKTALALHWAHRVERAFPDGQPRANRSASCSPARPRAWWW